VGRRAVQGAMAPGPQLLSEDQLRRTWSLVDMLTMLKRRGNNPPPTAQLILRKFHELSLPALDTLSILMEYTIAEQRRRLGPDQVCAMAHAVRGFPEDTASEIAHAHACERVTSADGVKRASREGSHLLRLGLEQLAMARKKGLPLCPIATDRHFHALDAFARGGRNDKSTALEILGVGDAIIPEDGVVFVSSNGLLTGTACCIAVMDRIGLPGDICCGVCYQVFRADELSICRRCDDMLLCKGCLGHAKHASECGRVRSIVKCMAQSLTPHIRESARRVAVVQLSSSGLMVPLSTTSIASPLIPSSLWESLSRCTAVSNGELLVYWRLLISFLADRDGDDQEALEYERIFDVQAANWATVEPPNAPTSKVHKLLPSERRRLRKEQRVTENRAKEEARAAAETAVIAEANAVLERQSSRPDATSAMLTSVLLKRGGTASPEVVARTRAKRDLLKAAEMRARKPTKTKARPEQGPAERLQDFLLAAALHIQQHARAWLRCRTKARRKRRSRAARHLQRSVRTWFLSRDTRPVTSSIPATAAESGNEGDDEDQSLCVVCLEWPRVVLFLTCAHFCVCEACASLMHACPLCRAEGATLRVYT
jgi:hypothetical protein